MMIDPGKTKPPDPVAAEETGETKISVMGRIMHAFGRLTRDESTGENQKAVQMFDRMNNVREVLSPEGLRRTVRRARGVRSWPVTPGNYIVSDLSGCVAVCVLTSSDMMEPLAKLPGVAISGRVYTPNLGIEKIIQNVTANPNIRYLIVCGKESPIFRVGQALQFLFTNGVDAEQRIIGAMGHYPVLKNLTGRQIQDFRQQVEILPRIGMLDLDEISALVSQMATCNPGPYLLSPRGQPMTVSEADRVEEDADSLFMALRPGGHREPLAYDPNGFFIITVDRVREEIVVRHYYADHTPAHIMRGRTAEPILLGLLREGLISQLSHAGYLGVELAKAELALRLGQPYEQDKSMGQFFNREP